MFKRVNRGSGPVFFVDEETHPQTIEVIKTRARPLGLDVVVGDPRGDLPDGVFGVLIQYPGTTGVVRDHARAVQRIHEAAHLEDVGGDGVARGVVSSLRRGRISDADALDRAGIVGRHGLALDHRHVVDAEDLTGDLGATAQDAAERGAFADLLEQPQRALPVSELGQPGLHGHADGGAHFDGIQAEIIVKSVKLGDGIHATVDDAVATGAGVVVAAGTTGQAQDQTEPGGQAQELVSTLAKARVAAMVVGEVVDGAAGVEVV